MIDTIVVMLNKSDYRITDPDKFTPSAQWALKPSHNRNLQSRQNPTKKELHHGKYKPRLTLYNRSYQTSLQAPVLKIELSLPKLFFGNNFAELQLKHFQPLIQELISTLATMGIQTTQQAIELAHVTAVHYSKNITLTDGSTPYHYIQKIKEANITCRLDSNQTNYRNEGHSYKWHSNAYEIVFYDKIKDLEKANISDKRALEKDSTLQLSLIEMMQQRTKKLAVLRMEVRLNTRTKMKQLFKKLGIRTHLTFKKLFKPSVSKKILLHYLDEIASKRPQYIDYKVSDAALLADLLFYNPTTPSKQIFQFYGLKKAFEAAGGMPKDILDQILETLNNVHQDKIEFHNKHHEELTKEHKKLTLMLDNLYMDKLKGRITENEYDRFYAILRDQVTNVTMQLEQLQEAEDNYYVTAKYLLDLSSRAHDIFIGSEVDTKRQLIKLVLSNLYLEGEKLVYDAHKPFDLLLNCSDHEVWRPQGDSNPCY